MAKFVWIEGYEGKYQIGDDGTVLSFVRRKESKPFRAGVNNYGYPMVQLTKNGKRKHLAVHILVAKHFVHGYMPGLQVNHKNCIKTDNRAENLEWVTGLENMRHGRRHGLFRNAGSKRIKVKGVHVSTGEELIFESIETAAKSVAGNPANISGCVSGRQKSHRNYRWSRA